MKKSLVTSMVAGLGLVSLTVLTGCGDTSKATATANPTAGAVPASAQSPASATKSANADIPVEYTGMLAKVFPSIVRIEAIRLQPNQGRLAKAWVGGSGVIISADGYIVTNCHVAEDAEFYRCYLYDGEKIEATLVGQDAMTDLAVLKLDLSQRAKDAPPLPVTAFGDSDKLEPGKTVFALGSPGFLSQSSTRGIVANPSLILPEQTVGKMILKGEDVGILVRWIIHDAVIFGGNSGGPLVNAEGEVVGINEIGVVNLSGAIPANLAQKIAAELIKQGHITRGWSGITVQQRLQSSGKGPGVYVSDIAAGSPAAQSPLKPGDIIVSADGKPIEGEEEKAIAHYYRLETSHVPGTDFPIEFIRSNEKRTIQVRLEAREPVQADDVELRAWGAVVRDLTRELARSERLPEKSGVWLQNIRPGGPVGQAEPDLRPQDVIIAVDNQPVGTVAQLKAITDKLIPEDTTGKKPVLVSVRRDGAILNAVVELRLKDDRNFTPPAVRGWLGAATQALTPKLATQLKIKSSSGGARITRVYPDTKAAAAGLKVGDVVVAIDGTDVNAQRQEDADVLSRMVRQYRAGTDAKFTLWRDGTKMDLTVNLEAQPTLAGQLKYWEDEKLEYEVREISFDDKVRLQLPPNTQGVLVASAVRAGWAELGGLRADDVILEVEGKKTLTIDEYQKARLERAASDAKWLVLQVQRRGQTLFVEIPLKPATAKK